MTEATYSRSDSGSTRDRAVGDGVFRHVVDVLPVATAVLDRSGIVIAANRALAELLQLPASAIAGEPFLAWLSRASEREGFGRAFLGLRERDAGSGFVLDLGFAARLGPRIDCVVRSSKLEDGYVAVTCHPRSAAVVGSEADLGLAVTRSLDALDQGVLLVDSEGRVVHANPAGIKLLGEGIIGRSVLELCEGTQVATLARALTVARAGSWQGEVTLRRLDGEPLAVEVSLAAGSGPAVMLLRDLRERRRREFEERLVGQVDRRLVSSAEPRTSVLAACAALGEALRASRIAVVAHTSDGWQRWCLQGDRPEQVVLLAPEMAPLAAWAGSRDVELAHAPFDPAHPLTRCFGSLEGCQTAARIVLQAPSGVVGHLLLAQRDPNPWGTRDRALLGVVAGQIALGLANGLLTLETRALAAYQAMVLDQTSVLLDTVDAAGRVVTWNRASEHLLKIPGADAQGRRFGLEVAVCEPGQWDELWATLLREGVVAREITLRTAEGEGVPVHLEARLLREHDEVRGAVLVGLDLRDRRTLEQQILRSQKLAAVGLLAAGIAHEINNPLSGVVGYSQLLLERALPPEIHEKVEKIAQSGERCRKIVEGVLLFSRQQDGGEPRHFDLRNLFDRVIAIGEYQWRMHNVRIIREAYDPVGVFADADRLEQVVLNLLSNAVDAMPRGGTIRLALLAEPEGGAVFSVADEGHGIPEAIQARIFDPFFTTKEIGRGTGLGLALSYGIVQDHGGDIVVESTPGAGAKFTVRLPPPPESERRLGATED